MSEFDTDSLRERGRILNGECKHYCPDWDFMTVDETCCEFDACTCYPINIPVKVVSA